MLSSRFTITRIFIISISLICLHGSMIAQSSDKADRTLQKTILKEDRAKAKAVKKAAKSVKKTDRDRAKAKKQTANLLKQEKKSTNATKKLLAQSEKKQTREKRNIEKQASRKKAVLARQSKKDIKAKKDLAKTNNKQSRFLNKPNESKSNAKATRKTKAQQTKAITRNNKALERLKKQDEKSISSSKSNFKSKSDLTTDASSQSSTVANASSGSRNKNVDEKSGKNSPESLYHKFGYKASIQEFERKKNLSTEDKIKIANSYRLNHDVENAAKWYKQVVDESDDPVHKLHYAQVLQSIGDKSTSIKYFKDFNQSINEDDQWAHLSKIFADNISDGERFKVNDVELRNEKHINTNKLEYSPSMYKDGITYVSTKKPEKIPAIGKDPWIDENFMALYYAPRPKDGELVNNPEAFSYDITTKFHEGPVSFTRSGEEIFFTRNHYLKGKRTNSSKGIMRLQIYTSKKTEEGWSTPVELPFNTKEYEECHPSVTSDAQTMYFASDRPGGFGGMDIYKSEFAGGDWGQPTNLGPSINTAGNEIFPFIHESGILFYASNGKDGLGGLDIFQSKESKGEWSEAANVGTPFNSLKDDFGFVLNEEATYGYLTSARNGGYGKDDIYSFALDPGVLRSQNARICTFLDPDDTRVSDAELIIKEHRDNCSQEEHLECTLSQFTDSEGIYETTIDPNKNYHITVKKEGYNDTEYTVSGKEILESDNSEYCIPLTKPASLDCVELETTVINRNTNNPIAYATVTLQNKCDGSIVEYLTDDKGYLDFGCIPCNCDYELIGSKPRLGEDKAEASTINIECTKENRLSRILKLGMEEVADTDPEFKAGDVIVLDNIYYDFDQFYIRDDAQIELDRIVTLMNQYPSMIIELGSHTDARATFLYNETLSSNRAKAAVEYIISRGIDARRLIAKGYGEITPRNECKDYVNCTEEQHQYNRRTEIKVIQFNEKGMEVQYEDKGPQKIDKADPTRKWIWR